MKIIFIGIVWSILCLSAYSQQLVPKQDKKGKFGFTDESGDFIIKPKYDEIHFNFSKGIACVRQKEKFILINEKGKTISRNYSWVGYYSNNLCPVNIGGEIDQEGNITGGKYGFIDETGKEIIPVKYNYISKFNEHNIAIVNIGGSLDKEGEFSGGKYGIINLMGKEIIKPQYTRIGDFDKTGIAWTNIGGKEDSKTGFFSGGKYGYLNNSGIEIVAPKYSFVGKFENGICWVNMGGNIYKMDKKTQQSITARTALLAQEKAAQEKSIAIFRQNLEQKIPDTLTNRKAIIEAAMDDYQENIRQKYHPDTLRKTMEKYKNELLEQITGGKKDVRNTEITGGKYGFLDIHGREITKIKYTQTANNFTEERAWVALGKKYGYIDNSGKEITKIIYEAVAPQFHNQMASVKQKGRWGFINYAGIEVTELKYTEVGTFESGIASVQLPTTKKGKKYTLGKYGFINTSGQAMTEFKYDLVLPTVEGITACFYDGGWCYINQEGKEMTPNIFLLAQAHKDGVAWAKVNETESKPQLDANEQTILTTMAKMQAKTNKSGMMSHVWRKSYLESLSAFVKTFGSHPGYYVLIGKDGKILSDLRFSAVTMFSEGLAAVTLKDSKTGYINTKGEIVIPFDYHAGSPFYENMARVQDQNYLYGFIDKQGNKLIPCMYTDALPKFNNNIVGVKIEGKWGGITSHNKIVIPPFLDKKYDVQRIEEKLYTPGGKKVLTPRQVKLFNIYQNDERNSYNINATIPDSLWDF